MLARWAERIAALQGWSRVLVALLAGLLSILAFAPFFLVVVLIPCLLVLYWLVQGADSAGRAFRIGWWWGLGHFLAGTYWISLSLLVEPEKFGWMIPFALIGFGGVLGLFIAIVSWLAHRLRLRHPAANVLLFGLLWAGAEYLRSFIFTGLPWNLVAYSWADALPMMQTVSLVGSYGLGLLTIWWCLTPALLVKRSRAGLRVAGVFILSLLLCFGWGAYRLVQAGDTQFTDYKLRLIQPNIPQARKWAPNMAEEWMRKQFKMSLSEGWEDRSIIIWPESAVPYVIDNLAGAGIYLSSIIPEGGALITGAMRQEGPEGREIWNSLLVFNEQGKAIGQYDKHHLVPFGEFVPLRGVLPVEKIAHGQGDFSRGEGPVTLKPDGVPAFSPLICYEAIFPHETIDPQAPRPEWLLNVTNDAWFGTSSGPHQHLASARMRAVEQGLPLVRVANSGISVVADGYGRILAISKLQQESVLDVALPVSLDNTIYGVFSELSFLLIVVSGALLSLYLQKIASK